MKLKENKTLKKTKKHEVKIELDTIRWSKIKQS